MKKQVQVRIFPDGRIEAEVDGVKGRKCADYIKVLEEIMQAKTDKIEYKADYYEPDSIVMSEQNQNLKNLD